MNQSGNDNMALRRMLREIADLAENASLTGGLASGAPRAIRRYNAVLGQLVESGSVPKGIFEELNPETSDYGQLGVDARLLASYLKGQGESNGNGDTSMLIRLAPFIRGEDLALLVKEHISKGSEISSNVITALAPFLGSEMLGELIRGRMVSAPAEAAAAPTPPTPPTAQHAESLQELLDQLRQPELSSEDRQRIATKIAAL
jgi:hypothetical protein